MEELFEIKNDIERYNNPKKLMDLVIDFDIIYGKIKNINIDILRLFPTIYNIYMAHNKPQ